MKRKIILFIAMLSILLTGCSEKDENSFVNQGKEALESHNYSDAKEFLSEALEVDSSDENARAMYMQAMRMENAEKYKEKGNYKKAIKELKFLDGIKGGSSDIKNECYSLKKELEKLYEQYKKDQEHRKENAKLTSNKDRYSVERDALNSNKKEEEEKVEENIPEVNPEVIPQPPVQELPPPVEEAPPQTPEI
ncbi:MAG: hypothetical protein RR942_11170 [Romboutsia sp.]